MKIVLISPYTDIQTFGVRTLSACLKKEGHETRLLFLPSHFAKRYEGAALNQLTEFCNGAGLIGISLMTNFFDNVVQITQRLKRDLPDIPVLWGGVHPTIRPEECLDYTDMICVGEGEEMMPELARRIKNGQDYTGIKGLWFKKGNNVIKNGASSLIQNLDVIPFPDYDYTTHYILYGNHVVQMNEMLMKKYTSGLYMTMPTRGCPFSCAYCCNNTFNKVYAGQQRVRKRIIDNIIAELREAKKNLPFIKCIKFDDDAFFIYSEEEMAEFSQKYKKNVGLPLMVTGATPITITEKKMSLLVDAGLQAIRVGIQTGCERTKKLYKRYDSNEQVEKAVQIINRFRNYMRPPQYDIILDNPWEKEDDLIETLMFLVKLPVPYVLSLFSLTFYPGTELYEKAKNEGIIKDDLNDVYRKYYHSCKKTYANSLFFLLKKSAAIGLKISPRMMFLLTDQKFRQLKINWLVYYFLKFKLIINKVFYLSREGLKDIFKGDWSRILNHIGLKA